MVNRFLLRSSKWMTYVSVSKLEEGGQISISPLTTNQLTQFFAIIRYFYPDMEEGQCS